MFPSQKCECGGAHSATNNASMRPGCFHPRNVAHVIVRKSVWPASMRPGCFHPRNNARMDDAAPDCHCFNEAGMFPSQKFRWQFRFCVCFRRFNEAGMFPSQKSTPSGTLAHGLGCFNEAGMFPSQKCEFVHPGLWSRRCFNEAGMFPSQKCGGW